MQEVPITRRPGTRSARARGAAPAILLALAGTGALFAGQNGAPPPAEAPEDLPAVVGPPRPGAEIDPDLQWLRSILQNPSNAPEVRLGAAQRIVARGSSDSRRIVDEALRSGDPGQIEAITSALDEEAKQRPPMLDALLAALASSPRELHPRLARLLAREGDPAAEQVARMALDPARPAAERLGAIYALGQFRGRDSVPDLMVLLDERRREPPEVIREGCDALERATGQRLGASPEAWRQWWAARRAAPTQELTIAALKEQLAQQQKQFDAEVERSAKLAARLRQSFLDLLPTLAPAERADRILLLLDDELPEVRIMGIGQVERLLRNGERPSDAITARVMDRLTDKVPAIRTRAVRLLDDLAAPRLPERLAEILPAESDPGAAEAMLRVLALRPIAAAYGPASARLSDPALADVAAMAVNRISDAGLAPGGWEGDLVQRVRDGVVQKATPELVRLLAVAGTESDRDAVTKLLADRDEAIRVGAAEGLRRAGRRRAVTERAAADPAVYGVAVQAIADQPASQAVAAALMDLPPRADQAGQWNAAMERVVTALPPKDLLAVDERLKALAFVDPRVREAGLRAALAPSANGLDATMRIEIVGRLADLLLDEGDGRGALLLFSSGGIDTSGVLRPRHFRAAILEGEYDLAATIEARATTWISLLESMVPISPREARPLADEITLRFGPSLTDAEKARLAAVERALGASAAKG